VEVFQFTAENARRDGHPAPDDGGFAQLTIAPGQSFSSQRIRILYLPPAAWLKATKGSA